MSFELISEEQFEKLSEDDEQCFVEFESICRGNMTRMLDQENSENFFRSVRQQYMETVYSVANECRILNIPEPNFKVEHNFYEQFAKFSLVVQGEVARIRVRGRRSRNYLSVQLTGNTKAKIEHYVSRLREVIAKSDLSPDRKEALGHRLNDLLSELEHRRLSLGKTMLILSFIITALSGTTTVLADGSNAVTTIMSLIGVDKESEENALSRLAPPPKALPAPEVKKPAARVEPKAVDLDDDIPF